MSWIEITEEQYQFLETKLIDLCERDEALVIGKTVPSDGLDDKFVIAFRRDFLPTHTYGVRTI